MTSTRTTVRANCFSARRWAVVAPTLPAPTTVILVSMFRGNLDGMVLPSKATFTGLSPHAYAFPDADPPATKQPDTTASDRLIPTAARRRDRCAPATSTQSTRRSPHPSPHPARALANQLP